LRGFIIIVALSVLAGCASKPAPANEDELKTTDQTDPETRAKIDRMTGHAAAAPNPGQAPGTAANQGPVLTIVYVTEIGPRGGEHRPGAVIFSSDPDSPYLQERPRPSRILKPIDTARMGKLLADLRANGLDTLPQDPEEPDAKITGERQFIFLRDGKRVDYREGRSKENAALFRTFKSCENIFIACSREKDEFVELEGREATPEFVPLNPDK